MRGAGVAARGIQAFLLRVTCLLHVCPLLRRSFIALSDADRNRHAILILDFGLEGWTLTREVHLLNLMLRQEKGLQTCEAGRKSPKKAHAGRGLKTKWEISDDIGGGGFGKGQNADKTP